MVRTPPPLPVRDKAAARALSPMLNRLAEERATGVLVREHGTFTARGEDRPPVEDVIVSNADSYHLLRFVDTSFDSSVFLHLWLGRAEGNLALARIRLGEMAARLVLG